MNRQTKQLAFLLVASAIVASCAAPAAIPSLADLEIAKDIAATESEEMPAIEPGRSTFHATDPVTFALASGKVQFVEFFAYWCTVCKAMAPTVHGLENIYSADVTFVYLDRDDPATAVFQEQLGYIYQPHFFLIDANGQILGQWRGYVGGEELQQAIVASLQQ